MPSVNYTIVMEQHDGEIAQRKLGAQQWNRLVSFLSTKNVNHKTDTTAVRCKSKTSSNCEA